MDYIYLGRQSGASDSEKKTLGMFGTFLQRSNQLEWEILVQGTELAIKGTCRIINSQEL